MQKSKRTKCVCHQECGKVHRGWEMHGQLVAFSFPPQILTLKGMAATWLGARPQDCVYERSDIYYVKVSHTGRHVHLDCSVIFCWVCLLKLVARFKIQEIFTLKKMLQISSFV